MSSTTITRDAVINYRDQRITYNVERETSQTASGVVYVVTAHFGYYPMPLIGAARFDKSGKAKVGDLAIAWVQRMVDEAFDRSERGIYVRIEFLPGYSQEEVLPKGTEVVGYGMIHADRNPVTVVRCQSASEVDAVREAVSGVVVNSYDGEKVRPGAPRDPETEYFAPVVTHVTDHAFEAIGEDGDVQISDGATFLAYEQAAAALVD